MDIETIGHIHLYKLKDMFVLGFNVGNGVDDIYWNPDKKEFFHTAISCWKPLSELKNVGENLISDMIYLTH